MTILKVSFVLALVMVNSGWCGESGLRNLVRRLVESPGYTGFDIHSLRRSGDRVTVTALGLFDPEKIRSEQVVSRMMFLIDTAFEEPEMIQDPEDRIPGVTLFFLNAIADGNYAAELKLKIARSIDRLTRLRAGVPPPEEVPASRR